MFLTRTSRILVLGVALLAAAVVATGCLITAPDGSVSECHQVSETYRHYGKLKGAKRATWHTHVRTVWRCVPVSGPTTTRPPASTTTSTTTTTVPDSVQVVSAEFVHPYQVRWVVDVVVGREVVGALTAAWENPYTTGSAPMSATATPGRYTFVTDYFAFTTATYAVSVGDEVGTIASVSHEYVGPPLCGSVPGLSDQQLTAAIC